MTNVTHSSVLNQLRSVSPNDCEGRRFGDVSALLADQARTALECMSALEMEALCGARRYERAADRIEYRNGYHHRRVQLHGLIPGQT